MITKAEFKAMSAYEKGYAVYMAGSREDEPHVPADYKPRKEDRKEFERGQFQAMLQAQDSEE